MRTGIQRIEQIECLEGVFRAPGDTSLHAMYRHLWRRCVRFCRVYFEICFFLLAESFLSRLRFLICEKRWNQKSLHFFYADNLWRGDSIFLLWKVSPKVYVATSKSLKSLRYTLKSLLIRQHCIDCDSQHATLVINRFFCSLSQSRSRLVLCCVCSSLMVCFNGRNGS